jgi:HK97 family phage prohead protease
MTTMKIEARMVHEPVSVRGTEGEVRTLEGYAAVFGQETVVRTPELAFREVIDPGAFADVLNTDVRALFNHDPNQVLGRASNGSLMLSVDEKGLKYTITPPATTLGRDVLALVERGDISGRPVTFPAYVQASVEARDAATAYAEPEPPRADPGLHPSVAASYVDIAEAEC